MARIVHTFESGLVTTELPTNVDEWKVIEIRFSQDLYAFYESFTVDKKPHHAVNSEAFLLSNDQYVRLYVRTYIHT